MLFRLTFLLGGFILMTLSSFAQIKREQKLLYAHRIYFPSGVSKLKKEHQIYLEEIKKYLIQEPQARVILQAHADAEGDLEFNDKLSKKRAESILYALEDLGVSKDKVVLRSFGEYVPRKDNRTEQGKAENRRVFCMVTRPLTKEEIAAYQQPTIKGRVVDAKSGKGVFAELHLEYQGKKDTVYTNDEGEYEARFKCGPHLTIQVLSKNYFFSERKFRVEEYKTVEANFFMEQAIIGGKMPLNELYFQGGTAIFLESSYYTLDHLVNFLLFNEHLIVELGGHINKPNQAPVSVTSKSFKLSEARAKAVYNYCLSKGIHTSRIQWKGYGNAQMLYPRAFTIEEKQMNRRVEIKVLEK